MIVYQYEAELEKARNIMNKGIDVIQSDSEFINANITELIRVQCSIVFGYIAKCEEAVDGLDKYILAQKAYAASGMLNVTLAYLVY